jgi:hypothetical protein
LIALRAAQPAGLSELDLVCMLTGVQGGGVLAMRSGAVTFESVAISDTSTPGVRLAWGGRSGPEAEWGGGVQYGGVVTMDGGSVRFKGGSIARSSAVRDPRC